MMEPITLRQELVAGKPETFLVEPWPVRTKIDIHLLEHPSPYMKIALPMIYINLKNGYASYKVDSFDFVGNSYECVLIEGDSDLEAAA